MSLTRDQILNATDLPKEEVHVPEWGGSIFVRSISAEDRDIFEASYFEEDGKKRSKKEIYRNIRARLVSISVCDEKGNLIFTEADIPRLGKKSAAALDRIFTIAQRLSGMSKKDVEELSKNSVGESQDSSPSGSPGS